MAVDPKPWGFDVSQHQARPNMATLWREGFDVAGVKMTEGWGWEDPDGRYNLSEAISNGMIPHAYHFVWGNDPLKQARSFYNAIAAVADPAQVGLVVDVESHSGRAEDQPKWTHVNQFVGNLLDLVGDNSKHIIIYTGAYWREVIRRPLTDLPVGSDKVHLWLSRYVSGSGFASQLYDKVPEEWWSLEDTGGQKPLGIQFASTATTKAVSPLDVSAWRPGIADLREIAGLSRSRRDPLIPYDPMMGDHDWNQLEGTLRMIREIQYRFPVEATTYTDHGRTGRERAADLWVAPMGERANAAQKALGNEIVRYIWENWSRFNVEYTIWDNEMREEKDEPVFSYEPLRLDWLRDHPGSEDTQTSRHRDHVHVSRQATAQ